LRALPCDRPRLRKSAQDRAAAAGATPALSDRELEEALAEGINTGHADMPAFELSPNQIHDLLSYLKTLE
jgi:mono/diheme cytochrome c family protein